MRACARVVSLGFSLCALAFFPAAAQRRASGIVRDTSTMGSLSGAVVSALDAQNRSLGRTITDATGRYSIDVTDSAVQLRVVRIGFRPRSVALPANRAASTTIDLWMSRIPTLLSAVVVSDEGTCSGDADRVAALSLWEQARAALLAAVVAREALPADATVFTYERVTDLDPGRVLQQTSRATAGRTTRPFLAADAPNVLAERGYVETDGAGRRYKAPDADVLLDESFARTHCFSVRRGDGDHAGMIGLAFEPARGRDSLVEVRGTLWLDVGVPALRVLEFGYTGSGSSLERDGAHGVIHFRTMSNGVVFVDDWSMRIPIVGQPGQPAAGAKARVSREDVFLNAPQRPRVVQLSETGGLVLAAIWSDGVRWETPIRALAGVVTERGSTKPVDGVLVTLVGTTDTVSTDSVGRFAMFPVLPGRYSLRVVDTALSAFISARTEERDLEFAGAETQQRVEVPNRVRALRRVCPDESATTSSLLVGRLYGTGSSERPPRAVRVSATWLRAGSLVQSSAVNAIKLDEQSVNVDDAGRFAFCGAPRERALHITASRFGIRFADTTLTIGGGTDVHSLDWRLDVQALARLEPISPATFRGRVTTEGGGAPVANAEVWFPTLDRRVRSDSSGAFWFDSLPAGHTLVQVRRLGFVVRRDTLTLTAGNAVNREYALVSQATLLDTVRTVADQVKYISPALRGFEERRTNAPSGYFIPESELRKHDESPLSSIITTRAAGLVLVIGKLGAAYLSSSRKTCAKGVGACFPPNCYVTTYIDGVLVYGVNSDTAVKPPDVNRIPVDELAGVEFYPGSGTAPPQYNATGSGCGVLLLWTRER